MSVVCRTTVGPTPTCPLLTKAATPFLPPPFNFLPTTSCLHPLLLPVPLDATALPLTSPVAQYFYPWQEVQAAVRVARDGHHYCCQGWPRMRTPTPRIVAKPAAALIPNKVRPCKDDNWPRPCFPFVTDTRLQKLRWKCLVFGVDLNSKWIHSVWLKCFKPYAMAQSTGA